MAWLLFDMAGGFSIVPADIYGGSISNWILLAVLIFDAGVKDMPSH
jgi:hypothetical protein